MATAKLRIYEYTLEINVKQCLCTNVINSHIKNSKNLNCEFSCRAHCHNAEFCRDPLAKNHAVTYFCHLCDFIICLIGLGKLKLCTKSEVAS